MTRFVHDQFAKDLLEELLAPLGEVQPSRKIPSEVREVDLWFSPHAPSTTPASLGPTLGLLGRFATQPASFEPFRNPVSEQEICDCLLKLLELRGEVVRQAKRDKLELNRDTLPKLWILTPTASQPLLQGFSAQPDPEQWPPGVYLLGQFLRTAIVVIHQLPPTPDTLWLRILGRGKVQQRAIDELEALQIDSPFRANALKLLLKLRVILEANQTINPDDQELIMRLAPLYEQKLEEATQKGMEKGVEQGERLVVENLLQARFGTIDPSLAAIIEPLLALPPAEFTPLLLNLSRDDLIDRFNPN
jgi:hypothetical protein